MKPAPAGPGRERPGPSDTGQKQHATGARGHAGGGRLSATWRQLCPRPENWLPLPGGLQILHRRLPTGGSVESTSFDADRARRC